MPPNAQVIRLPFEFIVQGPPRSAQTHSREALRKWKNNVVDAAAQSIPAGAVVVTERIRLCVAYYHDGLAAGLDLDNMVKPIQDALNGVVYEDDSQIVDTALRATCIDGPFKVRGMSMVLAEGFNQGREFLHVVIVPAPNHEEFLK